jgi:hypothetical protein
MKVFKEKVFDGKCLIKVFDENVLIKICWIKCVR